MSGKVYFETERLVLRQWLPSDRAAFASLNADQYVMEYFPTQLSSVESDALADRCEMLIRERGWGFWAAETKQQGEFIGFVGLHIPLAELPFSPCIEIGWRLDSKFWGKGYATEAANAALGFGFEILNLPEIVSFTTVGNYRSQAVMERLGMQRDVFTFEHPSLPSESGLREHCLYRLSYQQWKSR